MATMHINDVKALAHKAHTDAAIRQSMFEDVLADDGRRSSLAAWVLTHLPSDDDAFVDSHRDDLVHVALSTSDTSLRRLALTLLNRLEWPKEAVRTDFLDFTLEHLSSPDEPYGVRSLCIKLAFAQCVHYSELREELRQVLLMIEPSEIGSGIRNTSDKILGRL